MKKSDKEQHEMCYDSDDPDNRCEVSQKTECRNHFSSTIRSTSNIACP